MDRVTRIVELTEGPTVLDLGAVQHSADRERDDTWLHGKLADRCKRVIGVDSLKYEVMRLNKMGYDFIDGDAEDMDIPIVADTIVIGELIEHLSNPGRMLDGLHGHLKGGGKIILSTPNPWLVSHMYRMLLGRQEVNNEHTAWYGPMVISQLLERHGFDVTRIEYVGPDKGGLAGLLQRVGLHKFGYTTMIVVAVPSNRE